MNLSDLEIILGQAVRNVGSRVGIPNAELYSVDELRDLVKPKNPQVSERLEAFINSYWEWFDFHRRNDKLGKDRNLDGDEQNQLLELIQQRNKTRDQLLLVLPSTP